MIGAFEVTAYRRTGEDAARPYTHNVVEAILVIARPNAQTPITTLETRAVRGLTGEASLTATVARGICVAAR